MPSTSTLTVRPILKKRPVTAQNNVQSIEEKKNKRCGTCRFWDRPLNEKEFNPSAFYPCKNPKPLWTDGKSRFSALLPKKGFGCSCHEEIENNEKDHTN